MKPHSSQSATVSASVAVVIAFLPGCLNGPCPTAETKVQFLDLTLQTEAPSSDTWSNKLDIFGSPITGAVWSAAAMDATSVSPAFGLVILGDSDYSKIWIGLPFPLSSGDILPLTASLPMSGPDAFTVQPSGSGATLWLNTCSGKLQSNCALAISQTVQGTLTIEDSAPLRVRIDATVTSPTDSTIPAVDVHGDLSFLLEPSQIYCLSRGD